MSFVADASVAIKWFVKEELHEPALDLLDRRDLLHAPDLVVVEVANIAWKKCIKGEIPRDQAEYIAAAIQGCFRYFQPSETLIERALDIALTINHPIYDCLYLACAEQSDGVLVTADTRFYKAIGGTAFASRVQHLADFAAQ